jgi:hypothetical protein
LETVWNRLNSIGHEPYPIPLDEPIAGVTVTREFLAFLYGGNTQQTFPSIAAEKFEVHGLDDFMYPNLDFNPCAPQRPGAPGLFFKAACGQPADDWPTVQRVITRIDSNVWHYVGQYKMAPSVSLTKEEWAREKPLVFALLSLALIFSNPLSRFATHGLPRYAKGTGGGQSWHVSTCVSSSSASAQWKK